MAATYFGDFASHDDLPYGENNPKPEEVVYAGYTYENYSGYAIIVYRRDGKWHENNDGHCSCYGLEDWRPEETTPEALLIRPVGSWPGLHDAVRRAIAESAADAKRAVTTAASAAQERH